MAHPEHDPLRKVMTQAQAEARARQLREAGKSVGFTNGCFDLLHPGHLSTLQGARKECDALLVGVNTDDYLRRTKGPGRPVQDEQTRCAALCALECVDAVIVFDEDTADTLVRALRPDVTAKYVPDMEHWPEGRLVRSYGGRAVILPKLDGHSTTETLCGAHEKKEHEA